jgi:hypothetical protein
MSAIFKMAAPSPGTFVFEFDTEKKKKKYLAVWSKGCFDPTSFLICIATLEISSLNRHLSPINDECVLLW